MEVILEDDLLGLAPGLAHMRVADVPNYGQEPGAAVAATKGAKCLVGTQTPVLDCVPRVVRVTQKPDGKVIGGVQMGKHELFEKSAAHWARRLPF